MKESNIKIAQEIDQVIRNSKWFDFHVWNYDGRKLVIAGGIDLSYYHSLEIVFTDVFYVSAFFETWHSDTSERVFEVPIGEENKELNEKMEIEQGYQIFILKTEDYKNDIYIAAKEVSYRTETVKYQ